MNPLPKAGDIWRWDYGVASVGQKYAYVLLLEWEQADLWKGLDLDDGEIGVWYFLQRDMKYWKRIA